MRTRTFCFDVVSQIVENNDVRGCFFIVEDGYICFFVLFWFVFLGGGDYNEDRSSGLTFFVFDVLISKNFGLNGFGRVEKADLNLRGRLVLLNFFMFSHLPPVYNSHYWILC